MDFLKHREGDMVFYQVFLPSPLPSTLTFFYFIAEILRSYVSFNK